MSGLFGIVSGGVLCRPQAHAFEHTSAFSTAVTWLPAVDFLGICFLSCSRSSEGLGVGKNKTPAEVFLPQLNEKVLNTFTWLCQVFEREFWLVMCLKKQTRCVGNVSGMCRDCVGTCLLLLCKRKRRQATLTSTGTIWLKHDGKWHCHKCPETGVE